MMTWRFPIGAPTAAGPPPPDPAQHARRSSRASRHSKTRRHSKTSRHCRPGGAGRARATLAEIAAEAGVSLPTVSKVVNGHADVAAATRARVEQLLGERRYRHPGIRRGRHAGLIDVVFNGLDSPWAVEILRGVEEWCSAHGMAAAVSSVRHGDARPASWTRARGGHDTDGVLLVTSELTEGQLAELRAAALPIEGTSPARR